ncbi:MAG: glycosyltransferase [Ilumatobacteraceae bacterium]
MGPAARPDLERAAAGLANVRFGEFQSSERLPEVLATGDVHVVALKAGLGRVSVPSKTYSILAAGRPVVASIDPGTEVPRILDAAEAGTAVAPDDPDAFCAALRELLADDDRRRAAGESGRRWVEEWVSPAAVAELYEQLFERLRSQ